MQVISLAETTLRSANAGTTLAEQILDLLAAGERVRVDFASVQIMTPSFTNALVMRLLARHAVPDLRDRCEFVNRSQHVIAEMNHAVRRFQSGIRLSSQRATA